MKKRILSLLMIGTFLIFSGCGSKDIEENEFAETVPNVSENKSSSSSSTSTENSYEKELYTANTSQKELINDFITKFLEGYSDCEVTSLTILDAHNKEAPGTYHCHGIITFNGTVSADVAGQLIQNYSNALAEKLDHFYPSLTEMELIWMAPEFNGRATLKYEKIKNYLQITSTSSNSNFNIEVDIEALTQKTIEKAGAMSTKPIN